MKTMKLEDHVHPGVLIFFRMLFVVFFISHLVSCLWRMVNSCNSGMVSVQLDSWLLTSTYMVVVCSFFLAFIECRILGLVVDMKMTSNLNIHVHDLWTRHAQTETGENTIYNFTYMYSMFYHFSTATMDFFSSHFFFS